MRISIAAAALLLLAACATKTAETAAPAPPAAAGPASYISAALADPRRPQADRDRDADRHPAEILTFAQVEPGEIVGDWGPGGGYYTRLFSNIVAEGKVFAIIRPIPPNAERQPAILAVAAEAGYANLTVVQSPYGAVQLPQQVDTMFMSQEYHDQYLTRANLDVAAGNRAIFNAIKPGGTLIVIDHSAIAGSPAVATADTLHRIDEAIVRRDLEAAGFVYEADTQLLRNPADARTVNVFDAAIRGHTDQFALRFRRPG
ncbi:MAG: class I SAM-dependent methyltransferase [Hyphomonadaceae bacterium]|nr:class I SAM-dependent methyltransferase [Hyphomonadaceae bacterium]